MHILFLRYIGPYALWLSSLMVLGYAWILYQEAREHKKTKNIYKEILPLGCIFLQGIIGGTFLFLGNDLGCYLTILVFSGIYIALRIVK